MESINTENQPILSENASVIENEITEIEDKMAAKKEQFKCTICLNYIENKKEKNSTLIGIMCGKCFIERDEDCCLYCEKICKLVESDKSSENNYCSNLHKYLYENEIYEHEPEPKYYDYDYDYHEEVDENEYSNNQKLCIYCGETIESSNYMCGSLECEIQDYKEVMKEECRYDN